MAKQDRAQFTGMWKDAYLQDRRLFYSIPKTPPLTKQTNKQNKPYAFPLPQTYQNKRTNKTNRMPFPCPKLTPLSNHEFRAREQGGLYGDGQAGGREVAEANVPDDESVHV